MTAPTWARALIDRIVVRISDRRVAELETVLDETRRRYNSEMTAALERIGDLQRRVNQEAADRRTVERGAERVREELAEALRGTAAEQELARVVVDLAWSQSARRVDGRPLVTLRPAELDAALDALDRRGWGGPSGPTPVNTAHDKLLSLRKLAAADIEVTR